MTSKLMPFRDQILERGQEHHFGLIHLRPRGLHQLLGHNLLLKLICKLNEIPKLLPVLLYLLVVVIYSSALVAFENSS